MLVDVQAPYRWNLRRLQLGTTLDIGCGLGCNLKSLSKDSIGVDHNTYCIDIVASHGFQGFTPETFEKSPYYQPAQFDSLLFAHVLEHMSESDALRLIKKYIPVLKPNGQVVLITPQEYGFHSEPSHIRFMDHDALRRMCQWCDLTVVREYSFPLPRALGACLNTMNLFVSAVSGEAFTPDQTTCYYLRRPRPYVRVRHRKSGIS